MSLAFHKWALLSTNHILQTQCCLSPGVSAATLSLAGTLACSHQGPFGDSCGLCWVTLCVHPELRAVGDMEMAGTEFTSRAWCSWGWPPHSGGGTKTQHDPWHSVSSGTPKQAYILNLCRNTTLRGGSSSELSRQMCLCLKNDWPLQHPLVGHSPAPLPIPQQCGVIATAGSLSPHCTLQGTSLHLSPRCNPFPWLKICFLLPCATAHCHAWFARILLLIMQKFSFLPTSHTVWTYMHIHTHK